jgi:single-stranded DNA-binding protein
MISKFLIVGKVNSTPEIRHGASYVMITANIDVFDQQKEKNNTYKVVKFEKSAEKAEELALTMGVGSTVLVEGKITKNDFKNKNGEVSSSMSLVAQTISEIQSAPMPTIEWTPPPPASRPPATPPAQAKKALAPPIDDEEIPF